MMEEYDSVGNILSTSLKVNQERRKHTRIPIKAKARMLSAHQTIEGEVVNLSLKGAFVRSDQSIELNSSVTITIFDDARSHIISAVKAKVVRVEGNGVGLQFEVDQ